MTPAELSANMSDILKGTKAIGEFLGVSQDTAQRLIKAGKLPVFRFASRGEWRAREEALRDYVRRKEGPTAA